MDTKSTTSAYHRLKLIIVTLVLGAITVAPVFARQLPDLDEECLLSLVENGQADMTLGELRAECTLVEVETDNSKDAVQSQATAEKGLVQRRMSADREAATSRFSILAHKPNYFLLGAYNTKGWDADLYREASDEPDYDNKKIEGQFQISLKVPLALDLLGDRMDIYAAYTNRSFWQMYNPEYSEPFRETNHEPELWLQFDSNWEIFGLENVVNTVGWVHQSNGRGSVLSRSWDRLYTNLIFEKNNFVLSIKPWIWVSQDKANSDNPDITDFMGHGELRTAWYRNGHVASLMLRNQLESGFKRGALELSWSFPVFDYPYLKGYVQYFYGYGESLIDYDNKVNRIGLGISVTDWID